jgi:hypothetical protein
MTISAGARLDDYQVWQTRALPRGIAEAVGPSCCHVLQLRIVLLEMLDDFCRAGASVVRLQQIRLPRERPPRSYFTDY